jgi:hypothetical protein
VLVEANNGVFGGCWCMGFHTEGADKEATPALHPQRKLSRVLTGSAHAALVYDGEACVGRDQGDRARGPGIAPRPLPASAGKRGRPHSSFGQEGFLLLAEFKVPSPVDRMESAQRTGTGERIEFMPDELEDLVVLEATHGPLSTPPVARVCHLWPS